MLERECEYAADQFGTLAAQAGEAHAEKVAALSQEIQTQLWVTGATALVAPEIGGVISKAVVGLATRLGGETVGSIVAGIIKAIETVIEKVVAALGRVIEQGSRMPLLDFSEIRDDSARFFSIRFRGAQLAEAGTAVHRRRG